MFYTVLCQNSPQPSDQDKLNSIPSMSIFISFYKCRLMQEKVGRGRGQAAAHQDSSAQHTTALHCCQQPREDCPTQRPGSIPRTSCSAPMHTALLEGLAHQYCPSDKP